MVKTMIFPGHDVYVADKATKRYVPREVCAYRVASFSGPMRKHGGDVQQRQDEALRELDAVASARVASSGPGYKVRRAR